MLRSVAILTVLSFAAITLTPLPAAADIGFPSGAHYTLNILGKEKIGKGVGDKSTGGKIFVPLYNTSGICRIFLTEGAFGVKDADCIKDLRADFTLPNPNAAANNGVSDYAVYIRALGKPGGSAQMTSCFIEFNPNTQQNEEYCSAEHVQVARFAGQSPATDVTRQTLSVCWQADDDADLEREYIFNDSNRDYLWKYDNNGLRLAQLRFYQIPTDIGAPCP
jgi:hypothetical protein